MSRTAVRSWVSRTSAASSQSLTKMRDRGATEPLPGVDDGPKGRSIPRGKFLDEEIAFLLPLPEFVAVADDGRDDLVVSRGFVLFGQHQVVQQGGAVRGEREELGVLQDLFRGAGCLSRCRVIPRGGARRVRSVFHEMAKERSFATFGHPVAQPVRFRSRQIEVACRFSREPFGRDWKRRRPGTDPVVVEFPVPCRAWLIEFDGVLAIHRRRAEDAVFAQRRPIDAGWQRLERGARDPPEQPLLVASLPQRQDEVALVLGDARANAVGGPPGRLRRSEAPRDEQQIAGSGKQR